MTRPLAARRTPDWTGHTWADIVRMTLEGENDPRVPEEVPEPDDPRRFGAPAPSVPTRHDRPTLPPERHEPRVPLDRPEE